MQKTIHQFKVGDVVEFYGARFEILEDARESQSHRPMAGHLQTAFGPSDCAVAKSVCIGGHEVKGYIQHGKSWTFQGNHKAGKFNVISTK